LGLEVALNANQIPDRCGIARCWVGVWLIISMFLPLLPISLIPVSLFLGQLPGFGNSLLSLMRPQVEAHMTRECEKAMGKAETGFASLHSLCGEIARPASVCVVQEIERNGTMLQVAAEAMAGKPGPVSMQVAATCISRLLDAARSSWDKQFPLR
jgi:hypothetical protein